MDTVVASCGSSVLGGDTESEVEETYAAAAKYASASSIRMSSCLSRRDAADELDRT